jgi:hypothetical protein
MIGRKKDKKFDYTYDYVNFTTNGGELLELTNWTGIINLHRRMKSLMDRTPMFIYLLQEFISRMSNNYMKQLVFERGLEISEKVSWKESTSNIIDRQVKAIINWKRARIYW